MLIQQLERQGFPMFSTCFLFKQTMSTEVESDQPKKLVSYIRVIQNEDIK